VNEIFEILNHGFKKLKNNVDIREAKSKCVKPEEKEKTRGVTIRLNYEAG
jgi:hypothetical protein